MGNYAIYGRSGSILPELSKPESYTGDFRVLFRLRVNARRSMYICNTLYLILEMLSGLERWLSGEVVRVLAVLVEKTS